MGRVPGCTECNGPPINHHAGQHGHLLATCTSSPETIWLVGPNTVI